jgi:hypothetical protein
MYGNPQIESDSRSKIEHKFFEKFLNNNLEDLQKFLEVQYGRIESGELIKGPRNEQTAWDSSKSETTIQWNKYNVFQFYHPGIFQLFKSLREMTLEACKHYNLNFDLEQFMVQGWFNINYNKKGKLDWHEHGGNGAPHFHGYYCVKAEPSTTHYRVFDKEIENINKNNRAILSETGHPHAMADWDWDGPRITIAYDVIPLRFIPKEWEQHWIPMA